MQGILIMFERLRLLYWRFKLKFSKTEGFIYEDDIDDR